MSIAYWSTDPIPERDRVAYWVDAICEAFLTMQARPRRLDGFFGALERKELGVLTLTRVTSTAQDVQRREVDLNAQSAFFLITQRHQPWAVSQAGRYLELRPGDMVLIDAAQSYQFHCPHGVDNLSLELPRAWMNQWLAVPGEHVARPLDGQQGFGLALRGLLQGLQASPPLAACQLEHATQALGYLLQTGLGPPQPAQPQDPRWLRAQQSLRARFSEPGLQSIDVARDVGCSLATLHRLFSARGQTVAGALRDLRLQRAAAMLREPGLARVSVGAVGARCGYSDPSHFGRAFARAHGCSPLAWRKGR